MKYIIPDLPEDDQKAVGKVIFNPDFDNHEIKLYDLPSGRVLKVTYTTAMSGFEVIDKENWTQGYIEDLSTKDQEYIKKFIIFEPHRSYSGEFRLPSGIGVRISPIDNM